MRKKNKPGAGQTEFGFATSGELGGAPPLDDQVICTGPIPEQKTARPYSRIFADRPPGPNRYRSRRCR